MPVGVLATIQYGGYVNPWAALTIIVILLAWARLLAWIDKDAPDAHLPREIINISMMAGLVVAYLFFFLLPGFWPALGVVLGTFAVEIGAYLGIRAKSVGLSDLTEKFKTWGSGLLKSKKVKEVKVAAGEVLIFDKSGNAQAPPDAETPELPQYEAAQKFLTRPSKQGAEQIDLVAGDPPTVTFHIDGIRYEGDALDRNAAGAAVQYLKRIAGLDMNERRKPQIGNFKAAFGGQKKPIQITTYGSTAGESARLVTDPKNRQNFKIDALGFGEDQLQAIRNLINEPGGLVLLSAPRASGLTSLAYGFIRAHDAFMYHVHTIERAPEMDLEGITQNALPAKAGGAEEAKQVNWVISQEPDILMLTSIEDRQSAADLAKFAVEDHRAYVCLRAANTFEAIAQWRKLVGDDTLAMKNLRMVVSGRLVRRLCGACKVGYTPDPAQLRKLNMSPDVVGKLFSARKEPMRDAKGNVVPCNFCHDLAFKGRFGIYEIFMIDDDVRKIVHAGGSEAQLKQAFRKQRGKLLQDVALDQVKLGETSLEEVLRVLKADPGSASSGSRSAAPAATPPGGGGSPPSGRAAAPAAPRPQQPSTKPARG